MPKKPEPELKTVVLCDCVLDDHEVRLSALRYAISVTRPGEGQEARALATAEAMYRFLTGATLH